MQTILVQHGIIYLIGWRTFSRLESSNEAKNIYVQ